MVKGTLKHIKYGWITEWDNQLYVKVCIHIKILLPSPEINDSITSVQNWTSTTDSVG